jgi:hypothetical protein
MVASRVTMEPVSQDEACFVSSPTPTAPHPMIPFAAGGYAMITPTIHRVF